jgi:hypothetical protein
MNETSGQIKRHPTVLAKRSIPLWVMLLPVLALVIAVGLMATGNKDQAVAAPPEQPPELKGTAAEPAPLPAIKYSIDRPAMADAGASDSMNPDDPASGNAIEPVTADPKSDDPDSGAIVVPESDSAETEDSVDFVIEEEPDKARSSDSRKRNRKARPKKTKQPPKEKAKPNADSPVTDRAIPEW